MRNQLYDQIFFPIKQTSKFSQTFVQIFFQIYSFPKFHYAESVCEKSGSLCDHPELLRRAAEYLYSAMDCNFIYLPQLLMDLGKKTIWTTQSLWLS
jgi:hypothetical protein